MEKFAQGAWRMVRKVLKAPWEITGPASHPEYKDAMIKAKDYRKFGPATPPVEPCIPQDDPETIYDIAYYARRPKRGRKVEFDFDPHNPEHLKFLDKLPPGPKKYVMGNVINISDEDTKEPADGGYIPAHGNKDKVAAAAREKAARVAAGKR